ncbi:LptF/LptG family permease [Anatilimnocola sp. NA78]|uniref:LptF/LptG family permease n=1 Tax=Anatilimnocola sp. NA78 TaxID=3415683 RepID=UPI003CE5B535
MTTLIDRYVLGLYLKALIMSFLVMAGMYMLVDVFANLEEHVANSAGYQFWIVGLLTDYYGPRLLWVFDKTAGILAASAAIFAVTWLQSTQELTAMLAAGISPARVLRPILFCTILIALLGVANREIWLPSFRSQLARNAQDWKGDKEKNCTPQFDPRTDVLISGKKTVGKEKKIEAPYFRLLSPEFATWGRQVTADSAFYLPAENERPAGYLLAGVKQPTNLANLSSLSINGEPVLLSPRDNSWLKPDECFVVSVVTFEQFSLGSGWRQNLSTQELISGLKNRSLQSGADILVTMHGRFVKPLLDIVLVFLGLPLVLGRASRNIFVAGGVCLGLMGAFFIVSLICQGLGNNFLLRPTLAAWMPLMIFAPIAFTVARPLWD